RCGRLGKSVLKKSAKFIFGMQVGDARLVRVNAATWAVVRKFERAVVKRGKAVPAGIGDVGCPHGKLRRLKEGKIVNFEVQYGLSSGPQHVRQVRQKRRRPRAGAHHDEVRRQNGAAVADNALYAPTAFKQACELQAVVTPNALSHRQKQEALHDSSAFGPSGAGIEVAFGVSVGVPRREAPSQRL